MIGWFGDGNYYVGNVGLKPEIAHTVSGTAAWHDRARKAWEIKLTPYVTHIQDYVDVDTLGTATYGMSTFAQLRFANHNAAHPRRRSVWQRGDLEQRQLRAGQDQRRGGLAARREARHSTGLYQMMPLNAARGLRRGTEGI